MFKLKNISILGILFLLAFKCLGQKDKSYIIIQQDSIIVDYNQPIKTLIFCNHKDYPHQLFDPSDLTCIIKKRLYILSDNDFEMVKSLVQKSNTSCKVGENQCWYNFITVQGGIETNSCNVTNNELILFFEELKLIVTKFGDETLKMDIQTSIDAILREISE